MTFLYLANDVIQNSKKKGPEYTKEFLSALEQAFTHIAETCTNHNIFKSLDRLLNIWEQRVVYETEQIQLFRTNLNQNIDVVLEEHDRKRKIAAAENGGSSKRSKSGSSRDAKGRASPAVPPPAKPVESDVNGGDAEHVTATGEYNLLFIILLHYIHILILNYFYLIFFFYYYFRSSRTRRSHKSNFRT